MERSKLEKFRKDILSAQTLGLDTMCFIYQFQDNPRYATFTNILFELLEKNKIQAVTSTVSVVEVFIQPENLEDAMIIYEYEQVFQLLPNLEILPIDWHLARLAAKLRATYGGIRTPDALQLSAPLLKTYSAFITNDKRLKQVKEIKMLILEDYL